MKIIIYLLVSFLMGILHTNAQETETKTESTTRSSISISTDGDISFAENGRTYFSISDSDDTYKVRSEFHKAKTAKIHTYLMDELGEEHLTTSGNKYKWKREYSGNTGYEAKLEEGHLRIFVNKELVSNGLINKFKTITQNIKTYTSGKSEEKRRQERADREQDRLKREADRKLREAERLQREAERLKREAERLEREAKRKDGSSKTI